MLELCGPPIQGDLVVANSTLIGKANLRERRLPSSGHFERNPMAYHCYVFLIFIAALPSSTVVHVNRGDGRS
ncbi:hypothetical protein OUZ56_023360 [Daphnia magna]|uniref:Uncharacterized protein n=1 Tax=Daphnia magna TaxID=35525 RepID=A0ABR0AZ36_9CRUS|nr:hypothetical protein OUZ56_023360 [Daphnia magna]